MTRSTAQCVIAVGSNLGDRLANVRSAVSGLVDTDGVEVLAASSLYETAPVGGPGGQGAFYNAALLARTTLEPPLLLAVLHRLEASRDRERVVHWGPRTLDLDLLVHGDEICDDPALVLPHPRMHLRRFVMVPVCDVAPDLVHPRLGVTMRTLLGWLPVEPGDLTAVSEEWQDVADGHALA